MNRSDVSSQFFSDLRNHLNILVVDDDEDQLEIIKLLLERAGHRVKTAVSRVSCNHYGS